MALSQVCVFAGSGPGADARYGRAAAELGTHLAHRGVGVVHGGRGGLAGVVADAALAAGGDVIDVSSEAADDRESGRRTPGELRVVGSIHERTSAMADLSDAVIALPGGLGTFEALLDVATRTQLGAHDKPIGVLSVAAFWDDLGRLLDHAVRERFLRREHRDLFLIDSSPADLVTRLDRRRRAGTDSRLDGGDTDTTLPPRGPLVGTSAVVVRDGAVLLGRRRGAHGAGDWSFPGGKVEAGEPAAQAVARELEEETGLSARTIEPITWTDDVFVADGLHYVTLHHLVEAVGDPVVREPDKVREWTWHRWDDLPGPLFGPVAALKDSGWRPEPHVTDTVRPCP